MEVVPGELSVSDEIPLAVKFGHKLKRKRRSRFLHTDDGLAGKDPVTNEMPYQSRRVPMDSRQVREKPFEILNVGLPEYSCQFCNALFWYRERCVKTSNNNNIKYNLCCREGRVSLPLMRDPPDILQRLMSSDDYPDAKHFRKLIRLYNSMFSFTSFGCNIDESINDGCAPYVFKISGQICHKIGSLLPVPGTSPAFAQLYLYDTENEIQNRLAPFSRHSSKDNPKSCIVELLRRILDENNVLVKKYRSIRERLNDTDAPQLQIKIHSHETNSSYSFPSASEVVGFIVGDISAEQSNRDIIVEYRSKKLKRIYNDNPLCMPFQYPIIYIYGEEGYHPYIKYAANMPGTKIKRKYVTMAEFYAFRLHPRFNEYPTIFRGGKLFQQIVIDMYVSIEQSRLSFIQQNQSMMRSDKLCNIRRAVTEGDMLGREIGKRIILPSSYVGGPRYMYQNYHDCIALCRHFGPPDLFVTFTCNPQWSEIEQSILSGQQPNDRPDIICRVFKMKFDELIRDIKQRGSLGKVVAYYLL